MALAIPVRQVVSRYQQRLVLRVIAVGLLAVACALLVAWRVWHGPVARPWVMAGAAAAVAAILGWMAWSIRRRWLASSVTTAQLDQALGLNARLVTVAEFAESDAPPALYEQLVRDPALSPAAIASRLPRVADRQTALLAGLLVLLLIALWPRATPPDLRIAQTPPSMPTPTPPDQPPAPSDQSPQDQQHQSDRSKSGDGQDDQNTQDGGDGSPSPSPDQQDGSQGQQQQDQKHGGQSGQGGQANQSQGQQQQASSSGQQAGGQQSQAQQQSGGAQGRQNTGQAGDQRPQSGGSQAQQGTKKPGEQQRRGQSPGEAAQAEALKADIQKTLEQMSAELAQLQGVMVQSTPGQDTSSDLFEDPMPMTPPGKTPVPIQLETDKAESGAKRPGGGMGDPSDEIDGASPESIPEDVELTGQHQGEESVQRQAIPPEYRSVFERMPRKEP